MKKLLLKLLTLCFLFLIGCKEENTPVIDTGTITVTNLMNYEATASIFKQNGDSESLVCKLSIPGNGSVSQKLEIGEYRVFARNSLSLYFIEEFITVTKDCIITIQIKK